MSEVIVIGAGFAGISTASYLAAAGHKVRVIEKNPGPGGRARQLKAQGYTFDMGPSWYWMPDVFDRFFNDFGNTASAYYRLTRLDPAFEMVFKDDQVMQVPDNFEKLVELFDKREPGAGSHLRAFMKEAETKYHAAMSDMVYTPGDNLGDFLRPGLLMQMLRLNMFGSFSRHVRRHFSDEQLIALMEFPVLFLGAMPEETPALYSIMNYAGLKLGTWYPEGGFGSVVGGMVTQAKALGVQFLYNSTVQSINCEDNRVTGVHVDGEMVPCDAVVSAADYHHTEQDLLPEKFRNYSETYWKKRIMAPSCLIYFVGLSKKIGRLQHHTLFFDTSFSEHARSIYREISWPEEPLFYVCAPSRSDNAVAPNGHENLFMLVPVAPGLDDSQQIREQYFRNIIRRFEKHVNEPVLPYITYKNSYCINDFREDYNAYRGNAYGLANTLFQTAMFKPRVRNKKLANLFYAGQLTVPGPGVPPALISGKVAAGELLKHLQKAAHETLV